MSNQSIQFHKAWMEQCEAAAGIRDHFGLQDALNYLVGEKLFTFLMVSERDTAFGAEVPAFVAEIKRLFTAAEIHDYLDYLERTQYLAPPEPEDVDDLDEEFEEEFGLDNPVGGAEELLRFCRVRQLLQE